MDKGYGIQIVSVTILVLCFLGTASAANWSVDGSGGADFTEIQEAINNASAGDTIIVYSGVYYENVVVDKSVILKGIGQPVVDGSGEGSAITLTANGITLQGFNATSSGSSWNDAGIEVTSNNNTLTGNNVSNNNGGIRFWDSSNNNTITGNNVSSNSCYGIDISYSSNNNTITGNNVSNNNGGGISLFYSSNNKIYFNNFINNTDNVFSSASTNIWNSPQEITFTYNGTTYESYLGNYWSDYEGTDADGDGIGDTAYSIGADKDFYPLMQPLQNYVREENFRNGIPDA